MDNSLNSALLLLVVGMITVFLILSLVVLSGNLLIRLVNYLNRNNGFETKIIHKTEHVAVISAVVSEITKGKAKNIKIEKYD